MTRLVKSTGSFLALGQHVGDALVRGVAAGQHLAVEQQGLAGLPGGDFGRRQGVQIDAGGFSVSGARSPGPVWSRLGASSLAGPEPSRWKCTWRVAAQLGIIATGRLAAWVG
jgi:hypothetical protein